MNGITAKVAQKVAMFLQHDHIDPPTRQQKAEHGPCRSTAGNAAVGLQGKHCVLSSIYRILLSNASCQSYFCYRMDSLLRVLHLSSEHLFDRRNDEIRYFTAGGTLSE